MFRDLKLMFQVLEHIFQGLGFVFRDLRQNFPLRLKTFFPKVNNNTRRRASACTRNRIDFGLSNLEDETVVGVVEAFRELFFLNGV